ncbi:MAG: integrase family protein [Acidimicrobiales bacterium]|nr:integrase family protein [Acidimicrobiales bacterium]
MADWAMARKVAPVDVRLAAAVTGGEINVAAFCREHGISRDTFYRWRNRYRDEGLAGLEPRSSMPRTSPARTSTEIEDSVVALRKELDEAGLDAGAGTIQWHLGRRGVRAVPSVATIWRILVRRGFVTPEPRKRPTSSWRRFEAAAPNELWQTDATKWVIAIGQVEILTFLDDHSRLITASRAVMTATTENTWETFGVAVATWGLPSGQLSDNGLNFSGRLRGFEVAFEINLRAAGVRPITSRPFHPQTCGKIERFHLTLKKWLRKQPLARALDELQTQLDQFIAIYNFERPHRGIGRRTPIERWSATPKATNPGIALPAAQRTPTVVVGADGVAVVKPWKIHLGVDHAGKTAHVMIDDTHAAVFIDGRLARHLELDHTRLYQPSGLKRGGPRRLP